MELDDSRNAYTYRLNGTVVHFRCHGRMNCVDLIYRTINNNAVIKIFKIAKKFQGTHPPAHT